MPLKRKPSVLAQIGNIFLALAFFASQAFLVWRIVQSGSDRLFSSPYVVLDIIWGMLLLIVDAMIIAVPFNEIKRARVYRGALEGNDALVAPWRFPLDPALALPAGKTLTLTRPTTKVGPTHV